ncbi:uncharacterized protein BKA55DRAFT_599304 [Fusarium redolens]|uniref:Uncharacterized protein n=1 Tax=Fusarium redolens TaxID=48865 RepID=A0A9P9FZE5_FUSRE|nr:uncharacterized protein BKA55DRAFT_599304 [Fusarium redolens]KAH7224344.1 hypothetical protein BKA55DRAFT_599304 [Fusarium redolens]
MLYTDSAISRLEIQNVTFYSCYRACNHYKTRNCILYQRPRQCGVYADLRPFRPDRHHLQYIDGTGWHIHVPRWANYFEGCQKAEIEAGSHDDLYPMYFDGLRWVYGATRWRLHCQGCNDIREIEAQ